MYKEEVRHILPHLSPTELLKFFNFEPLNRAMRGKTSAIGESIEVTHLSLWDYLSTIPEKFLNDPRYIELYHNTALKIANKLVLEGLLSPTGTKSGIYQQFLGNGYDMLKADHNCYNFMIYGFPEVVDHFKDSVRIIEVKNIKANDNKDSDTNIGTGFALLYKDQKQYFITAKHCLPKEADIRIKLFLGNDKQYSLPHKIYAHTLENIDVAIINFSNDKLISDKFFRLEHPYLLDSILVMGYPPIPGTNDAVLVSSTGEVTAKANSYFHNYDQIYVNANIKGGSSGSPIINSYGNVIGIIIESPRDIKNTELQDELRFGTGLTSSVINEILESIEQGLDNHVEIDFLCNSDGSFKIK